MQIILHPSAFRFIKNAKDNFNTIILSKPKLSISICTEFVSFLIQKDSFHPHYPERYIAENKEKIQTFKNSSNLLFENEIQFFQISVNRHRHNLEFFCHVPSSPAHGFLCFLQNQTLSEIHSAFGSMTATK